MKEEKDLCDKVNGWLGTNYKDKDKIPWDYISRKGHLPEEFILRFYKHLKINMVFRSQYISDKMLYKLIPRYNGSDWYSISFNQNLPIDFIKENKSKLNKEGIFSRQRITPVNLEEYINIFGISSKEVFRFLNQNPFYIGYTEDKIDDSSGFYSIVDNLEYAYTSESTIAFHSIKYFPRTAYITYKNSRHIMEFWKVFIKFSFLQTNNRIDITVPDHIEWIEEINPWKRVL